MQIKPSTHGHSALVTCHYCGRQFWKKLARAKRAKRNFCNLECSLLGRRNDPLKSLEERFWAKVEKDGPIPEHRPDLGPCWLWIGSTSQFGHGTIASPPPKGNPLKTHRVSWEIHVGAIPDGLHVCHHCDIPNCVNPGHLFLGTDLDNMRDCSAKGRTTYGEKSASARLTESDVRAIRSELACGVHLRILAERYNVSPSTISDIKRRRSWKHLT